MRKQSIESRPDLARGELKARACCRAAAVAPASRGAVGSQRYAALQFLRTLGACAAFIFFILSRSNDD
jgi:hypothetical protein